MSFGTIECLILVALFSGFAVMLARALREGDVVKVSDAVGLLVVSVGGFFAVVLAVNDKVALACGAGGLMAIVSLIGFAVRSIVSVEQRRMAPAPAGVASGRIGGDATAAVAHQAAAEPRVHEVCTSYLAVTFDASSGSLSGRVLKGRLRRRRLDDLAAEEMVSLYDDCRDHDQDSADLLELWIERNNVSLLNLIRRETPASLAAAAANDRTGPGVAERPAVAWSREQSEAFEILGLKPGAASTEVEAAYGRLRQRAELEGAAYIKQMVENAYRRLATTAEAA